MTAKLCVCGLPVLTRGCLEAEECWNCYEDRLRRSMGLRGYDPNKPKGELLPCPFCGSQLVGELIEATDGQSKELPGTKLGVVGCPVCGCEGPSYCVPSEFVERWNQRALP